MKFLYWAWMFAAWLLFAGRLVFQLQSAPDAHAVALEHFRKHEYAEAVDSFRKALSLEKASGPEYLESTMLLGQSLYLSGHAPEAIPYLEKAPRTNEVLYMLGISYLRSRDIAKSEERFGEMFGFDRASAAAHLVTAQMMMRQELNEDAEGELHRTIAIDPKIPEAHYLLGELLVFKGAFEEGMAEFKKEIVINPNFALAYYKLGDAYTRQSKWELAIPPLQKSVWMNPSYSGPYILLGKSYLKLKELANAEGMLRHAVQIDPQNYSAHYMLGQTLVQEGKTEEGRQMLEQSQKLKP